MSSKREVVPAQTMKKLLSPPHDLPNFSQLLSSETVAIVDGSQGKEEYYRIINSSS